MTNKMLWPGLCSSNPYVGPEQCVVSTKPKPIEAETDLGEAPTYSPPPPPRLARGACQRHPQRVPHVFMRFGSTGAKTKAGFGPVFQKQSGGRLAKENCTSRITKQLTFDANVTDQRKKW